MHPVQIGSRKDNLSFVKCISNETLSLSEFATIARQEYECVSARSYCVRSKQQIAHTLYEADVKRSESSIYICIDLIMMIASKLADVYTYAIILCRWRWHTHTRQHCGSGQLRVRSNELHWNFPISNDDTIIRIERKRDENEREVDGKT